MGLKLIKEQKGLAALRFAKGDGEMVLHDDPDLPSGKCITSWTMSGRFLISGLL